jgi:hypothetical protein
VSDLLDQFERAYYTATRQQVDRAASAAESPTEGQKEAGNYKMGHVVLHGLRISIENAKGTHRRPEWPALNCHYGYIKGTEGKDGDHVDVFLGPHPKSEIVYVIDQEDLGGRFDEHKVMIGFTNQDAAKAAYLGNYTDGWRCGPITPMTIAQFRAWLDAGNQNKRAADQVSKYRKWTPTIAVDFDGTLVTATIGPDGDFDEESAGNLRPGAKAVMEAWRDKGYRIIIHTVRGNTDFVGSYLEEKGVPFDHINENPDQPEGASSKPLADVYVDDRAVNAEVSWERLAEVVGYALRDRYEKDEDGQGWRMIGGGAPALVDFDTGQILAGCPGLEDEDLDEIGAGESEESRQRRQNKQKQAEAAGWESESDKDARAAWDQAKQGAPEGSILILRQGDEYFAFGDDAQVLRTALQMGDGDKATFDADLLDKHLDELRGDGHQVVVAESTEGDPETQPPGRDNPQRAMIGDRDLEVMKDGGTWFWAPTGKRQTTGWVAASRSLSESIEEALGLRESQPDPEEAARARKSEQGREAPPRRHYNAQIDEALGEENLAEEGLREAFEAELTLQWRAQKDFADSINDPLSNILAQVGYATPQQQNGFIQALRKSEKDVTRIEIRGRRIFDELTQHAQHYPHVFVDDRGAGGAETMDLEQGLLNRLQRGFEPDPGMPSKRRAIPDSVMDATLAWLARVEEQRQGTSYPNEESVGREIGDEPWDEWDEWGEQPLPTYDDDAIPFSRRGDRQRYDLAADMQQMMDMAVGPAPFVKTPSPSGYIRRIKPGIYKLVVDRDQQYAIWLREYGGWSVNPIHFTKESSALGDAVTVRPSMKGAADALRESLGI